MEGQIVQLKGRKEKGGEPESSSLVSISRRRFLQVLGAGSAMGAAACASPVKQEIVSYVKPDPEQIPGVATWYSSTCTECSANCGIRVRTREGRAVKVEGNPHSPVNRGSLCALGQSSLQSLYDPDRIRTPLKRKANTPTGPQFEPVGWDEVFSKLGDALTKATNKKVLLTGELTTGYSDVAQALSSQLGFTHVVWDPIQPVAVAQAAKMTYGTFGVPTFAIDKAQVVVNFGADFLETWVNPVGYARQWSDSRRSEHPLRFVHVEPRLSLTGANADLWLKSAPGSEVSMVLFLIKEMLGRGRGEGLSADVRSKLTALTKGVSAETVEHETGVSKEKILLVAEYLASAESSLVLAGGTAAATADPLPLLVGVNFLNLILGNVGKTVNVAEVKKPASSAKALSDAIDDMQKGKVDVLVVYGTNPAFTFPDSFGFDHAVNRVGVKGEGTGKGAGIVVALASHLDETAQLADYVLPVHTSLEDWGYATTPGGAVSLIQPSMRPIFDTRSAGDVLMTMAANAGKAIGGDAKTFDALVKAGFLKAAATADIGGDSERFWMASLEQGGYFPKGSSPTSAAAGTVDAAAYQLDFKPHAHTVHGDELLLYPFPSVKSFDGRAANRPWMQELPDPITQAVWGAWAEVHSKTAKRLHLAHGDALILRTDDGEVQLPVYVSDYVHEDIVAVPLGQGHSAYGRYAKSAGQGNVFSLLPKTLAKQTDVLPMLSAHVSVLRGRGDGGLVVTQEFSSQMGRDLAKTKMLTGVAAAAAHSDGHHGSGYGSHGANDHGAHAGHHEVKQMYHQREHPLYEWGMNIDLAACTGCSACVVACYAENNIPVVGKKIVSQGREMSWIRIERYYDSVPTESGGEELKVSFMPMMCQHCQNAPCEPVCPVYATYHNEEGMNAMIYNRCVGTRYCSNNCSYKVRRFNWFQYEWPELLDWQVNPDVTKRTVGIMEKCTFCVQRIAEAKDIAKDLGRSVEDGEVTPACVQTCPTQAITFGNLKDPNSRVSKLAQGDRSYKVLDHHLNTQPAVSYLEDIRYKA